MDEDLTGRTLAGRYDVLAVLGSGGMGAVYLARDRELDEQIALKVIRPDFVTGDALARFRHEVKLARRVTHRNVARTFELGGADGIVFCTMELVDGESLRERLARVETIPAGEAVAIASAVCDGLEAAHAAGVIHRDIKPANVLIARDGRVVIADFGVAAVTIAETDDIAGTPAYMAPEQARGERATPAVDVYAVGVVLFEMLAGTRAFRDAARKVRDSYEPACAPELARIVVRATARDPVDRIATAAELRRLLAALDHAAPAAPPRALSAPDPRTAIVLAPRSTAQVAHLALELHEDVLARLAKVPGLRTLSRATATDEACDCTVELIAEPTLSAVIRRPGGSPLVMQLPLTVGELEATADAIAGAVAGIVSREPVIDDGALEHLLIAREHMQRGFGELADMLALLERASATRPDDPRVAALLAICEVRTTFFFDDAAPARLARARELVRRALATAPDRAESHVAAGHLQLHVGNSVSAARHFRDAITRAPHLAEAHEHLGRMLVEAGFIDLGLARLREALAIAPRLSAARWDVARAYALAGRWDASDQLVAELARTNDDRWVARARLAWWHGDPRRLADVHVEIAGREQRGIPRLIARIVDAMITANWDACRADLAEAARHPRSSHRRRAFDLQIAAEAAGYFGDAETCAGFVDDAADAGVFDLLWIDHCPALAVVRGSPRIAAARGRIAGRANAILDALYGDADDTEMPATAMF